MTIFLKFLIFDKINPQSKPIAPAPITKALLFLKGLESAFSPSSTACKATAQGSAMGASLSGARSSTSTWGPGFDLMVEGLGWAGMNEVPVVVTLYQRGGPSTGLPTKTEQADLLQCMFGRNSERPIPIVAAKTPSDCFWAAVEASRIAVKYMTPVVLLSDGYLGNGSEPWLLPKSDEIPEMNIVKELGPAESFMSYDRDPELLSRPWAVPGKPGYEHRIGGIEKEDGTGNISYDPENHDMMCRIRAKKVAGIANDIPEAEVFGEDTGDVLVLGWGGTYGSILAAVEILQARGASVSHVHLTHLNPFPKNLGEILKNFKKVLVPEINLGQLSKMIRYEFLIETIGLNLVRGKPFKISELISKIEELL